MSPLHYILIGLILIALLGCGCITSPSGTLDQAGVTSSVTETLSPSDTLLTSSGSVPDITTFHHAYGSVTDTITNIRRESQPPLIESSIYFPYLQGRQIIFDSGKNITLKKGLATGYMNGYFYDSSGDLVDAIPIQPEVILWVNRLNGGTIVGIPLPFEGDIPLTEARDLSISIRYANPDFARGETSNYELAYTAYVAWTE